LTVELTPHRAGKGGWILLAIDIIGLLTIPIKAIIENRSNDSQT
jgi:hypothetical protein